MLQVLINASIIWLGSLLIYEAVLKGTTFHWLNRAYMLLTFLAGIVLPLLPWGANVEFSTGAANSLQSIASPQAKSLAATTGSQVSSTALASGPGWLLILYFCGVIVAVSLLIRDLLRLLKLYRGGALNCDDQWQIVETGGDHAPFSFLHFIFVSSRGHYSGEQWQMLLEHEQQHFRRRHILDLALMQAAAILLWFHPLVYAYRQRLRMLHEYEVDSAQQGDIRSYGRFLLEQAACRPLAMTHSFNFSPLKNRIRMMTKPMNSPWTMTRFLLLVPMLSCAIWACTKNRPTVGVDINERAVSRRDAKLSFPADTPRDMIMMQNAETGNWDTTIITRVPEPSALNNQEILRREALGLTPHCLNPGETFGMAYLMKKAQLEPLLAKMTDGDYYMGVSDLIIDPDGRVAYYMMTLPENHSNMKRDANGFNIASPNGLSAADKESIQRKISEELIAGDIRFTRVKDAKGAAAPYFLDEEYKDPGYALSSSFTVKDHKLTFN